MKIKTTVQKLDEHAHYINTRDQIFIDKNKNEYAIRMWTDTAL